MGRKKVRVRQAPASIQLPIPLVLLKRPIDAIHHVLRRLLHHLPLHVLEPLQLVHGLLLSVLTLLLLWRQSRIELCVGILELRIARLLRLRLEALLLFWKQWLHGADVSTLTSINPIPLSVNNLY